MTIKGNYQRVFNLISVGSENAITCREISRKLNLSPRTVRQCIRVLILKHNAPIIGKRKGIIRGYFIPKNNWELQQGIKTLSKQLAEEEKRLNALINADLSKYQRG